MVLASFISWSGEQRDGTHLAQIHAHGVVQFAAFGLLVYHRLIVHGQHRAFVAGLAGFRARANLHLVAQLDPVLLYLGEHHVNQLRGLDLFVELLIQLLVAHQAGFPIPFDDLLDLVFLFLRQSAVYLNQVRNPLWILDFRFWILDWAGTHGTNANPKSPI